MHYRPEIDGLRAVAIVPVILFHAGFEIFRGGFVGVDVFFVISGYLITSIILREQSKGEFSLRHFYERRARRILPALFFVIACCIPVALLWMRPTQLENFAGSVAATLLFASNFWFRKQTGYFDAEAEESPLLHTWSLAVEEQFYLFFPLILLFIWPLGRKRAFYITAAIALLSLGLSEYGWRHNPTSNFYLAPTRAWELLAGSLCAFLHFEGGHRRSNLLSGLGIALIVFAIFYFDQGTPFPSIYAVVPVTGAALILLYGSGTKVAALLSTRIFVGIGLISYSAYLWHQPLFAFARLQQHYEQSQSLMLMLAVATALLAYLTWRYIEKPFRSRTFPIQKAIAFAATGSVVLAGFAGVAIATQGFPDRYDAADRYLVTIDGREQGDYVNARFDRRVLEPFNEDEKPDVLIIGDSYGKDFLNSITEAGIAQSLDISTYHIPAQCGNLFVTRDLSALVIENKRFECSRHPRYADASLRELIVSADFIILASSWKDWQVPLLPESVDNIDLITQAEIIVVGRKHFGSIDLDELLELSPGQRQALRQNARNSHIAINSAMKNALGNRNFLDMHALICGMNNQCPVFNDNGELYSFDGGHLTKAGAQLVGELVREHPLIDHLVHR